MKRILNDILQLFYPRLCLLCGEPLVEGEDQICLDCFCQLPRIRNQEADVWDSLFLGKSEILQAFAFYQFEKGGLIQKMIHEFKYHDNPQLAYLMGRWAFTSLKRENHPLCSYEILLPVPLHPKRLKERGYNQAEWIAKGIQSVLPVSINTTTLIREVRTETQTHRNVYERWTNMQDVFCLKDPVVLEGKRVLLVDDVLTTGATFNACASILEKIPEIKLGAFALAKV